MISPETIYEQFKSRFSSKPLLVQSPGRVNLIGEHTDYNNGFVLPAAIDKKIVLALARNNLKRIRLYAADMERPEFETAFEKDLKKSDFGWPDYILGVVNQLQKKDFNIGGFDCLFAGDIPIGAGLSSSAALEGGVLTGLAELFDFNLSRMEMARIGQQAENDFVGVQCGIMDQFANLHGKKGSVIRLDCRSLEYAYYPFERNDLAILLCDTKVRRELASSEYNIRRKQCEQGVEMLQKFEPSINSLRDVSDQLLEENKEKLDPFVYKRCRYVLDENRRVLDACDDLLKDDMISFGRRMYRSHYGLRDLYDVSCRELDLLVEATESIDSILGSRMMGGGFGGCTINLLPEKQVDEVTDLIKNYYHRKLDSPVEFYKACISEGAGVLNLKSSQT